MFILLVSVFRK